MKKLLFILSSAVLLTACANNADQDSTLVYINTGAIQCESAGQSGAETALLLTEQNITVSNTQCGYLANVAVIAMCGSIDTQINIHRISNSDLEKAQTIGFEDVITLKQADNVGYTIEECQ